jgi:hypothetical protein
MLSYFPVFFVVTGRCVDKGSLLTLSLSVSVIKCLT